MSEPTEEKDIQLHDDKETLLTQAVTVEYGVSVSTDPQDWIDDTKRVDDALIGFRFKLGKDEWTPRLVVPVFGATSVLVSLIHQLIQNGHNELALDLFRETESREEQSSLISLLTTGVDSKSDFEKERVYPHDEPTLDLIKATSTLISMVCAGDKEGAATHITSINEAGALEPVTRFMGLMAGRAIGYIAMMTQMDPTSVTHVLAGSALFESQTDDLDDF
jgi:hypothetical protein